MVQKISPVGRAFIEKWEECVLYVYDDKVPKRHINGKLQYPEWDGGDVVGTLTIGYGHTDAAGYPKIKHGLRLTKEQADEILGDDLAPCEANVSRIVKTALGQHQFDALVSFCFNCGAGNLKKLVVKLNQGDYDDIPRHLMQFVSSKGERMQGLVNRRTGEVALWSLPEDPEVREEIQLSSPQGEENDPPKSMVESKTGNSAIALGGGSLVMGVSALNEATAPIKEAIGNARDLGIIDYLGVAAHAPIFWIAIVMAGLAAFVWYDRHQKLTQDHV